MMNRTSLILATTLLLTTTLSATVAGDKEKSEQVPACPYGVWLGQQTNTGSLIDLRGKFRFRRVVDSSGSNGEDRKWAEIKNSMDVELRIIAGGNVKLPITSNGYTTLINGEVSSVQEQAELLIKRKSMFIVGIVHQKKDFRRYYTLNARITDGPLKGAVVHLRDDDFLQSEKDPFVAIYKIPAHINVAEEILEYQIIRAYRK